MAMFRTQASSRKRTKWAFISAIFESTSSSSSSSTSGSFSPQKHKKQKSKQNETKSKTKVNNNHNKKVELCSNNKIPAKTETAGRLPTSRNCSLMSCEPSRSSSIQCDEVLPAPCSIVNQSGPVQCPSRRVQPSNNRTNTTVRQVHHKPNDSGPADCCTAHSTANNTGNGQRPCEQLQCQTDVHCRRPANDQTIGRYSVMHSTLLDDEQTVMDNCFYDVYQHSLRPESDNTFSSSYINTTERPNLPFQVTAHSSKLSFAAKFSKMFCEGLRERSPPHEQQTNRINFHCVSLPFLLFSIISISFVVLFISNVFFPMNLSLILSTIRFCLDSCSFAAQLVELLYRLFLLNSSDILWFQSQLERLELYSALLLFCCFYYFSQQVNSEHKHHDEKQVLKQKCRRRRKQSVFGDNFCPTMMVCLILITQLFDGLPSVGAQFPNDEIEAALEPPPSVPRPPPLNNQHRDHHRHRSEQKQTEIGLNITRILNAFFDSGYDKRVRPNYAGPPVEVGVTMHIISISSISAVQMDFTSDFYFRQAWRDSRLSFTPRPGIEALYVGAEVSEKIWVPDTFFANEKSAQFHMATTPNTFIRIKANGEVFRSMRLTVTSNCPMNLQYFPMDRQSCTIEVESYGYSMADIQYKWGIDGKGSVNLANNLELPQFKVNKHRQMTKVEVLSTGNYSRLVCEIEFVRSMGYYLIQIYIPASLIVIISWVSFWLHRNASPARVQLGVTTVLTMTTLMSSTNAAMPKISYIKSIDVFLGTCFVMVFAALLEYATVGYMGKRIAMRKSRTQQIVRMLNEHRERCIAAAAAAAASAQQGNGKIGDDIRFTSQSVGQNIGMVRTASLYQDLDDGTLHKRDSRSGSCYPPTAYGPMSGSTTLHRSLERTASMKSRIYSDCDDPETTQMNNFNDDLSVFVQNTGTGTSGTVGGSGTGAPGPGPGPLNLNGQSLAAYQLQERNSDTWLPNRGISLSNAINDRPLYLPSNYVLKDHNTLFGVCPSDIDKYSRVVFPVCFLCFNLMYWIIYMHISEFLTDDQGVNTSVQTITDPADA